MSPTEPQPEPAIVSLTSAKQMRALAHPLRLRILGELRIDGPRTVGALADLVDEASGTLSYHLGKLAEFGFVEEAPELASDRREHWWRAAHDATRITPSTADAPAEERQASAAMLHQVADLYAAALHAAVDAQQVQPREWVDAGTGGDTVAYLTVAELAEASAELDAVLRKWHAAGERGRPGAEAVQFIVHAGRRP
ncbi:helix-turn-helix domain-containing protein [Cryobacterium sp. SO2]|uniref:ArsR/SmtB family transcription factor n=1 Tax=Cryobacterium sp. SO2 TaxID=1897060 RepID=UPI00223D3762|nr:helix-turn-helix domain-containing protein [Cryobacterium sp. SO2]WEO77930.1 helix-turn-helix domain-containing protein [Cryobacterium sp. SO2]